MRSSFEVDLLLRAVGDAAAASRAMTLGVLEARASAALDQLAGALRADRACLCYAGAGPASGTLDRFVSGGRPDVAAVGPALLAVPIDDVTEWTTTNARPVRRGELSPGLAAALAGTTATWILSVALHDVEAILGTLTVVGRGEPPAADLAPAVAAITELMHAVARRAGELSASTPTLAQARLALDLVEEGVLFLDPHGRVGALNRAARDHLGCGQGELDPTVPLWEQFDVRFLDGTPVADSLATEWFDRMGVLGPVGLRVVNRRGLVVSGQVTVRAVELGGPTSAAEMLVVFAPSSGTGGPAEPAAIESVLRRADAIFEELQRAIGGAARPVGPDLPPRLATIGLSARERDVVALLLEGHRVSTIAQRLFLSPHTVRNHLKGIFRKAKVGSQAALIDLARTSHPVG